jgi:transposase
MRGSEALQGVRMLRFRSVLGRYEADELNLIEAAEMLGVSERTFRRWCRRFEAEGETGLLDRRLGRPSGKRVPADDEAEVERLYRTRYRGFTARHFHEHLVREHLFRWSYTWTKLFLQSRGLLDKAPRRGVHRRKRPASTFRALLEVFTGHGLPLSLYTDRGSHYFHTPEAGGKVDRAQPTQVGRALAQLSIEHIAAYSPQARGRSERLFGTLQGRVPKDLALAGITTVEAANAWLRDTYILAHNTRFATKAEQEGSAFVAMTGLDLAETLCVQEERIVGNDNCVSFESRKLRIPESPLRPHFVKATVKVHQNPNGGLAIFHGRRCLGRYDSKGAQIDVPTTDSNENTRSIPSGREDRAVLGTVKDASRRSAVTSPKTRPSLTAPPRDARSRGRSAPGNCPDSRTRKSPPETPLLRRTKQERAAI